ncbi:MAG: hypothetical protein K2H52_12080 [Lachnospiraceae bacterium]|nr:hypothetical protein [Lachnospiraceae bacterium]MDE6185956.1 hypothetical protein [Lachnospiraceae bacterium]
MEYIIFAAVMAGIIVLFMAKGLYDYKQSEKKFIRRLYSDYGVLPQREYKPEQFENISHYYLKHADGFGIDDITWNDLNMDEIFKKMNYTYSAAGEEYLYYLLRSPCMEEEELLHREEIIRFFQEHEDERVAHQFMYHKLGRTGKFSIYDYLDYLDGLGERSNMPHYLALILLIISIGVLFTNVAFGLLVLVGVLAYNNVSYFKVKGEIDPYIVSFAYVFRLLDAVKTLKAKTRNTKILKEEFESLKKSSASMDGFKRGAFIIMSGGRMSGSGNPLDMLLDFVRMGLHLDLIKFNQMLSEIRKHISDIDSMITILGKIEAMIAIGEYRASLEEYCTPAFLKETALNADEVYHPLINEPVKNTIHTSSSVLITGSNASGKSTFLKTVAINSLFAQTIHTCLAKRYETALFRMVSSMSLKDDVQSGDSYYMVEIKSIKRILDMTSSGGIPVLCFVDEVLRGTNTVERIAASTQILKSLCRNNCICFAATHDIELTHLLDEIYCNYHFSEKIQENDISFTYKIMEGRASSRNAIRLLGIMGYESEIIAEAEKMAADFLETGVWHRLDYRQAQ